MKHLLLASTSYQVLCLAAAADEGLFADGETVLVLADGSQVPELTTPLTAVPGFEALVARFDRVVDLAALLYPQRPFQFAPRATELHVWERLLRAAWDLGDDRLTLWLDTIAVNPSPALARIFHDATLNAHSDGLMAYGPTRSRLPLAMLQRVDRLVHLDLVPGLRPMLLSEAGVRHHALPAQALRRVIDEVAPLVLAALPEQDVARRLISPEEPRPRTALVLGQYLSRLQLLDEEEEQALHTEMLETVVAHGAERCLFKPHPSAGPTSVEAMRARARELDVELVLLDSPVQAEMLLSALQPDMVAGAFSTGLATAAQVFGLEVHACGTEVLLERLTPYENSNRVPVTLVDACFRDGLRPPADDTDSTPPRHRLQDLLTAVAYCMQPVTLADHRETAERYLRDAVGHPEIRYFKRRRLTALKLPGALEPRRAGGVVARVGRAAPRRVRRLLRRGLATRPF